MRKLFKMNNKDYLKAIAFLRSNRSRVSGSSFTEYEWYTLSKPDIGYNAVSWANFIILRARAPW